MLIVRPSGRAKDDVETCRRAGWQAEVLSPIEIEADAAGLELLSETICPCGCRVLGQSDRR
ncbi:uroporphyrinogen-III synthase domain protein [Neisseria meningitidis 992008]|nr:uroporphyrinogen-III synthase domain protein [Neisseria meningitidis 992008]